MSGSNVRYRLLEDFTVGSKFCAFNCLLSNGLGINGCCCCVVLDEEEEYCTRTSRVPRGSFQNANMDDKTSLIRGSISGQEIVPRFAPFRGAGGVWSGDGDDRPENARAVCVRGMGVGSSMVLFCSRICCNFCQS